MFLFVSLTLQYEQYSNTFVAFPFVFTDYFSFIVYFPVGNSSFKMQRNVF